MHQNHKKSLRYHNQKQFSGLQLSFYVIFFGLTGYFMWHALAADFGEVSLDNGTCSTNLQLGSDKTASNSNKPSFLFQGNGGLSKYDIYIDGTYIGRFSSDGFAKVCVYAPSVLPDGSHRLTGNETQPNPANTLSPFDFSVDTVPPPTPSVPVMASFSDSGIVGDNITRFKTFTVAGTSDPLLTILILSGEILIGGALASSAGTWSAASIVSADGVHTITATATDSAANSSSKSAPKIITIDGVAPAGSITYPANGAAVSGIINVTAAASDALSGVWKIDFLVDGVVKATDTSAPYSYNWDTGGLSGNHSLSVVVHDVADNTTSASLSVTVQSGGPVTGDLNGDGRVDIFDLSILLAHWNTADAASDINHDGTVNIFDLSILLSHYGS